MFKQMRARSNYSAVQGSKISRRCAQLSDLGKKINSDLRPVFTRKTNIEDIKVAEAKPPLINQ